MDNDSQTITCPLCAGGGVLWGIKNASRLFQCETCKLIFVHPLPRDLSIYTQDYFAGAEDGFGYVDYDSDKEPMVPVFNKYLDLCASYGKAGGSLFDIGAATGFFLQIARTRGFAVSGVEMSEFAAAEARKKGLAVSQGDVLSQGMQPGLFDVVTMIDVVEHMTDPVAELKEVDRIMKPGGLLLVNTPHGESLLARLLKARWHLVVPPEHLHYFSPKNLGDHLSRNGFTVLYSGTIGKSFTLTYIFKTLQKWQAFFLWRWLSEIFSKGILKKLACPINLHDNFVLIARKNNR